MPQKTVLFIVADEATNKGESDYMIALAGAIHDNELSDTQYLAVKRNSASNQDVHINSNDMIARVGKTPLNNAQYKAVPFYDPSLVDQIQSDTVQIIAVGNSTLSTLKELTGALKNKNITAQASYVTHMVNNAEDLQFLVDNNVTLCTNAPKSVLDTQDSDLAKRVQHIQMDALPHTNSRALCQIDHDAFMQSENGQKLQTVLDAHQEFAFAVLNGGCGIGEQKTHTPYTMAEAATHFYALGKYLPNDTALVIADGGPRNLTDRDKYGQDTMPSAVAAYQRAQQEKGGNPVVIVERFEKDLPYNVIKAAYIFGQNEECIAFCSNAEGDGTMDGAVLHIDNQEKLLFMMPFEALRNDTTGQRQDKLAKYNKLGITIGEVREDRLFMFHDLNEKQTPYVTQDGAQQLVQALNLVSQPQPQAAVKPFQPRI